MTSTSRLDSVWFDRRDMAHSRKRVGDENLFFVVAVLLAYATESYSLACPLSYTSDWLAQCHGRCADIHRADPTNYTVCVNTCCDVTNHDRWSNVSSSIPTGCPFSALNCSIPDGQVVAPVVKWINGKVVLHHNSSAVATGTDVCSALSAANATIFTPIVLVQVQDRTTNASISWLLFAGMENELNELNDAGCYSVSVATVTKCGQSELSQSFFLPPRVYIDEVNVSISHMDDLPVISVNWHTSGVQDVSDPVTNITMYGTEENKLLPHRCPTTSKLIHGSSDSVQFLSGDFQNESVWLCTYNVHILLSYWSNCTETENSAVGMSTTNVIFKNSAWLDSYKFLWNESTLTYTLLIHWTVPSINGFRNIVASFNLRVLYPTPLDIPPHSYQNFLVEAEEGKYHYVRNFTGYLPLDEQFSYPINSLHREYVIILEPSYSSHIPSYVIQQTRDNNHISLAAPGEPPSSIGNLTVITENCKLFVMWEEPIVSNGGITGYIIEITSLGDTGKLKTSVNYTNETTYCVDLNSWDLGFAVASIFVKVAASNKFQTSVFRNATNFDQNLRTECLPATIGIASPPTTGIVSAVVLCFIVVLLLIAVVLIVLLTCRWRGKQRPKFSVRWHRGTHNKNIPVTSISQLRANHWSFSQLQAKLPPDIEDRWNIAYSSFVPESFRLLGSGNFSTVYLCRVKAPLTTPTNLAQFQAYADQAVAVKLLKGNATEQDIKSFFNEADVMKRLSSQSCNYVVQLVGLQVEQAPVMIAMELIPCGNLLDILKSSRISDESDAEVFLDHNSRSSGSFKKKMLQKTDTQLTLVEFQLERSGSIDSYVQLRHHSFSRGGSPDTPQDHKIILKPSQLLKFALQVSRGMEYLISCRVLHRDLACRNLLLSSNGIVKISDFGLACFLDDENCIVADLPTEQKPLRWMAPEAYTRNSYSEASDVWSFGVTVWEIFSKGVFPYGSMSDEEVLSSTLSGSTLERPTDSDPEVYSIMLQCWKLDSRDRPSFKSLVKQLDQFIYKLYPYMMMEIQECANEDGGE